MDSGKAADAYSRSEIRRILGINENSLRSWERVGLTESKETYNFSDLISLKTLQGLRDSRISAKQIRDALHQLRLRLAGVKRPLNELKIVSYGRRIAVELEGQKMEALTGQLLFNFDAKAMKSEATLEFRSVGAHAVDDGDSGEAWFQYALELEQSGAPAEEVIGVYRKVVKADPDAAGAWVNMGTLHYRQRQSSQAEHCYRQALQSLPEYPLAHFNLGNVCDEAGRLEEASRHYEEALKLKPDYEDAYYNLALLEERRGRFPEAARHWKSYLALDEASPWADIARRKRDRLLQVTAAASRQAGGSLRKPMRDAPG